MLYRPNRDFAIEADANDVLGHFKTRFHHPKRNGKELVYLCGNSLGLQPKSIKASIEQELEDWAQLGVEGHFAGRHPWANYHKLFLPLLQEIVGAAEHELAIMNSLTVNLHLMLTTFYRPNAAKYKMMVEHRPFSSDRYALESQVRLHGFDPEEAIVELGPDEGGYTISPRNILETIERHKDELSMILLGAVNYYSGQAFDIPEIVKTAHRHGILVGLDLAHAIGNIELRLHEDQVDFAVWCTYKYLNSGPGGVGGLFIHEKHANNKDLPRLAGWWGHQAKERFKMEKGFVPEDGADGWHLSNAPVLSIAAHKASLEIFKEAGMERLVKKSRELTGYLQYLLEEKVVGKGRLKIKIITPPAPNARGCQLSLLISEEARDLYEQLLQASFVVDYRQPDVIRISPVPLYNTFQEVFQVVEFIRSVNER